MASSRESGFILYTAVNILQYIDQLTYLCLLEVDALEGLWSLVLEQMRH